MSTGGARAPVLSFTPALEAQLRRWLDEDIGRGDLTAPALVGRTGRAHWVTRADGVFCGGVLVGPLLSIRPDPRRWRHAPFIGRCGCGSLTCQQVLVARVPAQLREP
jgi:hypothetical protein